MEKNSLYIKVIATVLIVTFVSMLNCGNGGKGGAGDGENPPIETGLILNEYSPWYLKGSQANVWASVSLKDSGGGWVTGRELNDFQLSETLISPSGEILEEHAITFDHPSDQFDGDGFWEKSVTAEKLDIVFVIDETGSMSDEFPGIWDELTELVDRMMAARVDFRIGFITHREGIADHGIYGFYNVMYRNELYDFLNAHHGTTGEGWDPTTGYDFLMLASHSQMDNPVLKQLEYRNDMDEDYRKVIVVITDTVPQSVYGNRWYLDSTAANRSAAEIALEGSGFEVFYSQPEKDQLEHIEYYLDNKKNPRADCGYETLGEKISWPFRQEDIPFGNGEKSEISDSQYYFAWRSNIYKPDDDPENHRVKVTIKTQDPEDSGNTLEQSFEYSPYQETTSLILNLTDERGNASPVDDLWAYLYREMGGRKEKIYYQLRPENGQIVIDDIEVGKYHLLVPECYDRRYAYERLTYRLNMRINVPGSGLILDLQLETGDREIELAKARGLIRNLKNWGVTDKPFRGFADDAEAWLDGLDTQVIDWDEMERIKRFYVALSGYVNASGYAEVEAKRITEDFEEVLLKFRDIIDRVRGISHDSKIMIGIAAAEAAARWDLGALLQIIATEVIIEELKDYAEEELVPIVIEKIIEQINFINGDHKVLLEVMINSLILGHWDNWPELLETIINLTLDGAMDAVIDKVGSQITDSIFDSIGVEGDDEETIKEAIKEVILQFARQGFGGDFSSVMENVQSELNALGSRDQVILIIDNIFNKLYGQLSAGPIRDFIFPMIHLIINAAVEEGEIDDDVVIKMLAHYFTHLIIVTPHFSEPVADQLDDALMKAKAFPPQQNDGYDRCLAMQSDFKDFRCRSSEPDMDDLNDDTWSNLSTQELIDNYAEVLSYLSDVVAPALRSLFYGLCCSGYPTCTIAEDVKNLIAVLDAVGLMTKVLELGLKAKDLTNLADDVDFINNLVLVEE